MLLNRVLYTVHLALVLKLSLNLCFTNRGVTRER